MTTESGAPAGDFAAPAIESEEISLSQARQLVNSMPDGAEFTDRGSDPPAEREEPAAAEQELPEKASSDPEADPAVTTNEPEPEDNLPPLEAPRSWSKDEKEAFTKLPRDVQEISVRIASARETEFRRAQNELADARKAAEARAAEAERVKQQYEAQIPSLMKELENVTQANFADIKTMDDVVRLQTDDPFRFQAWQVHQMRLQAAKAETDRVQRESAQAKQGKRANYEAEQNKVLVELVPEMADPKKASELRERAVAMLKDDLGLKDDQLSRWMQDETGHEILANAGIQKLIADGLKYRDILSAPKAVAAKPLPQVQKPGVSRPAGEATSSEIQALERKPELSEAEGWKLLQLKAAAQSRRGAK